MGLRRGALQTRRVDLTRCALLRQGRCDTRGGVVARGSLPAPTFAPPTHIHREGGGGLLPHYLPTHIHRWERGALWGARGLLPPSRPGTNIHKGGEGLPPTGVIPTSTGGEERAVGHDHVGGGRVGPPITYTDKFPNRCVCIRSSYCSKCRRKH